MSKKRRILPTDEMKVKSEEVSYRVFFHSCVARGLVQQWQEKEIHAFFRDLGLKDKEPAEKYKDALAKY
jgi:hypothetical protein